MTEAADSWGPVGERLRAPREACSLDEFALRFHAQTLTWRMADYAPLAIDPGLIGRIRGAFGAALLEAASPQVLAGEPCPWTPPCAAESLWRKQGRLTKGTDFPAPWLLGVDPFNGALDVSMTLFGFACDGMGAAAEAMTAALMRRVDWRGELDFFTPQPRIAGRRWRLTDGLDLAPPDAEAVELDFLAPAALTNVSPLDNPRPLFSTLPLRIAGLARWHDLDLAAPPRLGVLFEDVDWRWIDAAPVSWRRGSRRQDRRIPMSGAIGRLRLSGSRETLAALWPFLKFGEVLAIGADVAFGCGRYVLRT